MKKLFIYFIPTLFLLMAIILFSFFYNVPKYKIATSLKNDNIATSYLELDYDKIKLNQKALITDISNNTKEWGIVIGKDNNRIHITSPNMKNMSDILSIKIQIGSISIIESIFKEVVK